MTKWWRSVAASVLIFGFVLAALLFFPEYSDTIRRFIHLPPVSEIEPGQVETAERWAQEVLRTAHNLVYYIWVVGAIGVGLLAAISYYFFTWLAEHREIIRSLSSWQETVKRSEDVVLKAVQMLPGQVFLDFSDPGVYQHFDQSVENMLAVISPEEIDIQIANTALVTPIPSEVYLRLGNYFRFRAHIWSKEGREKQFKRDLWYATRRYERARGIAKSEAGKRGSLMFGHASHGIALCLLHLKRNADAVRFAKEAMDHLEMEIGAVVLPLITYGVALKRSGRVKEATEVFEEAERTQFHVLANYNLACCYARLGDEEVDSNIRGERYKGAILALERITGRLGSHRYVIEEIDIDKDFNGIRTDTLFCPMLEKTIQVIKSGA